MIRDLISDRDRTILGLEFDDESVISFYLTSAVTFGKALVVPCKMTVYVGKCQRNESVLAKGNLKIVAGVEIGIEKGNHTVSFT